MEAASMWWETGVMAVCGDAVRRGFALFAAGGVVISVATGGVQRLSTFQDDTPWHVPGRDARRADWSRAEAPLSRGMSGRITFPAGEKQFYIVRPRTPIPLVDFKPDRAGRVDLAVYNEGPAFLRVLGIRLVDADGERFRWKHVLETETSGWRALSFRVDLKSAHRNWHPAGGRSDGRLQTPVKFEGIDFVAGRSRETRAGTFYIDDLEFFSGARRVTVPKHVDPSGRLPVLEALDLQLAAGGALRILRPDEADDARLVMTNRALEKVTVTVTTVVEDFSADMSPVRERQLELAGGESKSWLIPLKSSRGLQWINTTLTTASGDRRRKRLSVCVMEPSGPTPGRADGFLFGLCAHLSRYTPEDQRLCVRAAGLCGAKIMRSTIRWRDIQPRADAWEWARMDEMVALLAEQNIESQVTLGFTPEWATTGDPESTPWSVWSRKAPRLEAWSEYVHRFSERYGGRIRFWETWNEPNGSFFQGSVEEFVDMQKTAYARIKANAPEANVLSPGFAVADRNPDFYRTVVDEAGDAIDILAWHRHGPFPGFAREVDDLIVPLRNRHLDSKPLYFNETALYAPSATRVAERRQAMALVKKLTFSWSRGAIAYNWYKVRDHHPDFKNAWRRYGMFTYDFYPKPVYPAYNTLTAQLRGKRHVRQLDLGDHRRGFVFEGRNESVVVAWADRPDAVRQVLLAADASRVNEVDMMGNRRSGTRVDGGRALLRIDTVPHYTVLRNLRGGVRVDRALVKMAAAPVAPPGESGRAVVRVFNPLPETTRFTATLSFPAGMELQDVTDAVTIRPGKTGRLTFRFRMPAGDSAVRARQWQAKLHFRSEGGRLDGSLPVAVYQAVPLLRGTTDGAPDFVLESRSDVVNRFDDDPALKKLHWHGPDDLSARIWLRAAERALHLRVAVSDDRFHQPHKGTETWRGDNLQAAMQVPGQDGYWALMLTRLATGRNDVVVNRRPEGFANPARDVALETSREPGLTLYQVRLPFQAFGLSREDLEHGIRFNLIANDNDGGGRKGWVRIAGGIGSTKDPTQFPHVVLK